MKFDSWDLRKDKKVNRREKKWSQTINTQFARFQSHLGLRLIKQKQVFLIRQSSTQNDLFCFWNQTRAMLKWPTWFKIAVQRAVSRHLQCSFSLNKTNKVASVFKNRYQKAVNWNSHLKLSFEDWGKFQKSGDQTSQNLKIERKVLKLVQWNFGFERFLKVSDEEIHIEFNQLWPLCAQRTCEDCQSWMIWVRQTHWIWWALRILQWLILQWSIKEHLLLLQRICSCQID